jgi:hypothetical protein
VITPNYDLVARIIGQGHLGCVQLVGQEPVSITIPFSKEQQNWLWQFSDMWQKALANFPGQLNEHLHFQAPTFCINPFLRISTLAMGKP